MREGGVVVEGASNEEEGEVRAREPKSSSKRDRLG